MIKTMIRIIPLLLSINISFSSVGIGIAGGALYPGFMKSNPNGSRFATGPGYEFFINHKLLKINPGFILNAQYSLRNYFCDIDLTIGEIRFQFNYLSIDLVTNIVRVTPWEVYAGGGAGLLTISGSPRYSKTIDVVIVIPELITGIAYSFSKNFNLFSEVLIQFGSFESDSINDIIPVTGLRLVIGGTMFLTSE